MAEEISESRSGVRFGVGLLQGGTPATQRLVSQVRPEPDQHRPNKLYIRFNVKLNFRTFRKNIRKRCCPRRSSNAIDPHVNVGTIGHVDHGKTTLTAAITQVMAALMAAQAEALRPRSTAPPRRRPAASRSTPHTSSTRSEARHYAHVDCPGHADYVKNMITGASQMDGAILLVDGCRRPRCPRPSSTSCSPSGERGDMVVVRQQGRPGRRRRAIELVEEEVRELLNEYDFDGDNTPIIKGSATMALDGDEEMKARIVELGEALDNPGLHVFVTVERHGAKPLMIGCCRPRSRTRSSSSRLLLRPAR